MKSIGKDINIKTEGVENTPHETGQIESRCDREVRVPGRWMSRLVKSSSAWAGVTGPTSGMDRSMDFELARRGLNIVIVVCDPNQLQILSVADTITKTHAVQSKRVVFDLSFVSTAQGETNAICMIEHVVTKTPAYLLSRTDGVQNI